MKAHENSTNSNPTPSLTPPHHATATQRHTNKRIYVHFNNIKRESECKRAQEGVEVITREKKKTSEKKGREDTAEGDKKGEGPETGDGGRE